ncbi:MAG TPA: hypothetical protein VMT76_16905 [Puia sp.]|nr:hypothetical protein [Puia sp.]
MKIHLTFVFVVFLIFAYGCDYICTQHRQINPTFIGFHLSDIDTFIVRAYKPNDNYSNLIDSIVVVEQTNGIGNSIYTTSNDTTIVYINDASKSLAITYLYDWQIYIPAKNKTVLISNIMSASGTGKHGCLNTTLSFVQDGQAIIAPQLFSTSVFYTSGYRAYIKP